MDSLIMYVLAENIIIIIVNFLWLTSNHLFLMNSELTNSYVYLQKDFFTKTWGDNFVEVTDIPGPHYLPNITWKHFQEYLKDTGKVSGNTLHYSFLVIIAILFLTCYVTLTIRSNSVIKV